MVHQYVYTPNIWPSIIASMVMLALAVYSARNRHLPATLPFTFACVFAILWSLGAILEYMAVDFATKVFWHQFQVLWQLLSPIAITCFILDFAWPGRWLTRRNLLLLSVIPLAFLVVILTNEYHHLFWKGYNVNGHIVPIRGPLNFAFMGFGYFLGLVNFGILIWLFLKSAQNRWPVVLMFIGQLVARALFLLDAVGQIRFQLPYTSIGLAFLSFMYALVLFSFKILSPTSIARQAVIEQLPIGILVLDNLEKVAGMNPAAESMLGLRLKSIKGAPIRSLLSAYPPSPSPGLESVEVEFSLPRSDERPAGQASASVSAEGDSGKRDFQLRISQLNDWRGLKVGSLLQLRDITEQNQTQAKVIDQERALATLKEREQLARELHDSLGQSLAAAHLQASSSLLQLTKGDSSTIRKGLESLAELTLSAEKDLRAYLLFAARQPDAEMSFWEWLRNFAHRFHLQYGIRIALDLPVELESQIIDPPVDVQLRRIVQEGLSNVYKHANVDAAAIQFSASDQGLRMTISDQGKGFNPASSPSDKQDRYGLRSMRERAEILGGQLEIHSEPDRGTQLVILVPWDGQKAEGSDPKEEVGS